MRGSETISYAMADSIDGPWTDGVALSNPHGCYTIHPGVVDFQGMTYMFYHDAKARGITHSNGQSYNGADFRRSVAVDYLYFDDEGRPKFLDKINNSTSSPGLSEPPVDQ